MLRACGLPFHIFARIIFILQNNISLEYYWIPKKQKNKKQKTAYTESIGNSRLNYIAKERQGKRLGLVRIQCIKIILQ